MTATAFESRMERIKAGTTLTLSEIRELCAAPDVLALGALADAVRQRRHGTRATYLRVVSSAPDQLAAAVTPAAREVTLSGTPSSLSEAEGIVRTARQVVGSRWLTAFSWEDVTKLSAAAGVATADALTRWRGAGLDALAVLALDTMTDVAAALEQLHRAGFEHLCLGVNGGEGDRLALWSIAASVHDALGCVAAINPLPRTLKALRPTTGYDDVKMVAAARLAAPSVAAIQLDWLRYGPKLAQVALTFGADDIWGISASDESPEGRRRAPVEEIRRNIEAAGLVPVERDARFAPVA